MPEGLVTVDVVVGVMSVLAIATLVRATVGFGDALLAMPVLTVLVGVRTAAPLITALSLTVAAVILRRAGGAVITNEAVWLLVGAVPGVLVGVLSLRVLPEATLAGVLGVTVCLYGVSRVIVLFRPAARTGVASSAASGTATDATSAGRAGRLAPVAGFAAGAFGSATGAGGPPVVMYGVARGWPPLHFRATLQVYFLCAGALALIGYVAAGLWTSTSTWLYVASLPGVLLAVATGSWLALRVPAARFARVVALALVALGASLLIVTAR